MKPPQILTAVAILACASVAEARQDSRRLLEEERRKTMDERERPEPDARPFLAWDAGGWTHLEVTTLHDEPEAVLKSSLADSPPLEARRRIAPLF